MPLGNRVRLGCTRTRDQLGRLEGGAQLLDRVWDLPGSRIKSVSSMRRTKGNSMKRIKWDTGEARAPQASSPRHVSWGG